MEEQEACPQRFFMCSLHFLGLACYFLYVQHSLSLGLEGKFPEEVGTKKVQFSAALPLWTV